MQTKQLLYFKSRMKICCQYNAFKQRSGFDCYLLYNVGSVVVDSLFVGFCVWSLSCYAILVVISRFAIIWLRKRELVASL